MTELRKLPECYTCDFYAHSPYLVCSEYPLGPEGDRCQTYAPPTPFLPQGDFPERLPILKLWRPPTAVGS
jgi:hypothetical protein